MKKPLDLLKIRKNKRDNLKFLEIHMKHIYIYKCTKIFWIKKNSIYFLLTDAGGLEFSGPSAEARPGRGDCNTAGWGGTSALEQEAIDRGRRRRGAYDPAEQA